MSKQTKFVLAFLFGLAMNAGVVFLLDWSDRVGSLVFVGTFLFVYWLWRDTPPPQVGGHR